MALHVYTLLLNVKWETLPAAAVGKEMINCRARGSEWGIYFSLYTYVRTYRNMSRSGMLIGMLRVSGWPIEFYLLRGLDGARTTTFRNRSVDERAVLQGLQSWSSYIWSQTVSAVDICLYRDSTIVSRSQRLGYKRAGPSGLAELEQLHVESNSECNRHVYLSSSLANSLLVLISTWPGCACGRGVRARQLCGYVFLVKVTGSSRGGRGLTICSTPCFSHRK